MVNVEIDDGYSAIPVNRARMKRADRNVVEQTKPHRAGAFGVMTGRTHGAERVAQPSRMNLVDGRNHRARSAQSGVHRTGRHHRVGIDLNIAVRDRPFGTYARDGVNMLRSMRAQKIGLAGARRLDPHDILKGIRLEPAHDRTKPVRALGMSPRRQMSEAVRMAHQSRPHGAQLIPEAPRRFNHFIRTTVCGPNLAAATGAFAGLLRRGLVPNQMGRRRATRRRSPISTKIYLPSHARRGLITA